MSEEKTASLPRDLGKIPSDGVVASPLNLTGKRVLLLFPHMVMAGGALAYTLRLAEQLLIRGATVAFLALRVDPGKFRLPAGLEVISLDGPLTSSLGYWLLFPHWQKRIEAAIAAWRPNVVVPQVFPANWWGWLYKRRHPDAKLVWICHEPSAFIHSQAWIRALQPRWKGVLARILRPFLARLDVALVRYSDRIFANSRFTAGEMERIYGVAPDGIASPGIEFEAFSIGGGAREPALISVGRLTRFKRVDFLLEVFRETLKSHPDLVYHIVGTGEEEARLRALARELGVGARVVFHGAVTDSSLVELYQRSLLCLHGSINEPFGIAPLEAIACGTPVVAHRSGGPAEFVTADCGRLVDSREVAPWAREVADYLDVLRADKDYSPRVRDCARRFDWPLSLRPAVEIILEPCGKPRHRALGARATEPQPR